MKTTKKPSPHAPALLLILIISLLFPSCKKTEPLWLDNLRLEAEYILSVTSGDGVSARLFFRISEDGTPRKYSLEYLSPASLSGVRETFDGECVTLFHKGLDGYEVPIAYEGQMTDKESLGIALLALFTPSAVIGTDVSDSECLILTEHARYYLDRKGAPVSIYSDTLSVKVESARFFSGTEGAGGQNTGNYLLKTIAILSNMCYN